MSGRATGLVAVVVAVVLGVAAAVLRLPGLDLPVGARLAGVGVVPLGVVAGRVAVLIPLALAGLALLAAPLRDPWRRRLLADLAAAPIVVFLVAQLNGLLDLPALVLLYAATAATVLLRGLAGRGPYAVAGMLGIVPWGAIAFQQVGSLLAGGSVPLAVRVVTLVVLVLTVAEYLRRPGRGAPVLAVLPPLALAVGSLFV